MAKPEAELKRKVEERYMVMQLLQNQMKELEQELENIQQRSAELSNMKSNLKELGKTKPNSKAFTSIGLGLYSESEIKDTQKILVNVGSGVLIKKSVAEAEDMLQKQVGHAEAISTQIARNLSDLAERAQEIESELRGLMRQQ